MRNAAHYAAGRVGVKKAVPALEASLKSDDPLTEVIAAWALAKLNPDDATLPLACYALGKIGPTANAAVTRLQTFLDRPDAWLRVAASVALVRIRPDDNAIKQTALLILSRGLADEQEHVRLECAIALGELGDTAKSTVPALRTALQDSAPGVRQAAKDALARLGEK